MRKTLEKLMERAAEWSEEAQAELVESMIDIEERHAGTYRLSNDERAAVRRGLQDFRDGKVASDNEVADLFARYRHA